MHTELEIQLEYTFNLWGQLHWERSERSHISHISYMKLTRVDRMRHTKVQRSEAHQVRAVPGGQHPPSVDQRQLPAW